jgi:drug/metabolite transporter (DMT)-like permease
MVILAVPAGSFQVDTPLKVKPSRHGAAATPGVLPGASLDSAIPFLLYAFAALFIPASLSVVLNSTAPMFGAVFSAIWLSDRLTFKRIVDLAIGICGVSPVTGFGAGGAASGTAPAVFACLPANAAWVSPKSVEGVKLLKMTACGLRCFQQTALRANSAHGSGQRP